jgi:protein TonB
MRLFAGGRTSVSSYRGTADRPDQAKAIAAVVAVHAALAFVILSGIEVRNAREAVERMTTIAIERPPPRPPPRPRAEPKPRAMKKPEGATAKQARPTPVVAPQPRLPTSSPIPAAKVAGAGTSSNSGAALAGNGTGAGGAGSGIGGGGNGAGFTPAQKVTKIPNQEYRRLVAVSGMERGTVGVAIRVTPDGIASNCRVLRSSGNSVADALMCQLTEQYVRFRPARDPYGRAVAQDVIWYPNWWRP